MKNFAILALGVALFSGSAWAGPHHMSFNPMGSKDWQTMNGADNGKVTGDTQVKFDGKDGRLEHLDRREIREIEERRIRLERLIRLLERDLRLGHGDRDQIRFEISRIERSLSKDDGTQTNNHGAVIGWNTVKNVMQ
jgi:hypothetical protein